MSLSRTIFKNLMAQVAGRLYTSALSFIITMVLLARILSEEDFGIFNYYLTLFYISLTIIDFGANAIVIREASKDESRLGGLIAALLVLRGCLSLICLDAVCGIALVMERTFEVRLLVCLAAGHLLFHTLGGFNTVFHVKMRFDLVALVSCIGHTLFFAGSVAAFLLGSRNPGVYLAAFGAGMTLTSLSNYFFSRPHLKGAFKRVPGLTGRLFQEALPLGISTIMVTVYFYVDTLLLRPMKGDAAVAFYSAAYRILVFSLMVPVLFNQVIFPVYSKCCADPEASRARLERIFQRTVLYMGVTGIPAAAALIILAKPLIVLVCGERYARSAHCLSILSLALVAIFLTYPHLSILVASGRQVLFAWIAGLSGLVNIGLNLLLIPRYSFEGAAYATVATETLVLLCAVACVHRVTGMNALAPGLFKIPAAALAVAAAAFIMQGWNLFLALPLLGVIYIASLFAMGLLPFDIGDEDRN